MLFTDNSVIFTSKSTAYSPTPQRTKRMENTIRRFINSSIFQNTIIALISINAVILGLETSQFVMKNYGGWIKTIDKIILTIFIIEILLRIYAYRLRFFTQAWSIFDFCIIAIALIPSTGAFSALRTLRILRTLRLISTIPSMRRVIEGLLRSIPGILSVALIMMLFFYIFAVIGTQLYGPTFPDWFGTLGKTMFTLFQIMTLESWSMGIVRPVMEQHPHAWLFFVLYILVTTFTMLNLFIAIIVNAMHSSADEAEENSRQEIKHALQKDLVDLEKRLLRAIESNQKKPD